MTKHRPSAILSRRSVIAAAATGASLAFSTQRPRADAGNLELVGDLRKIGDNSLAASTTLRRIVNRSGMFGIGMVEGLAGELLVFDSFAYLGFFDGFDYRTRILSDAPIAFGAYAHVPNWRSSPLPPDVTTFRQLESHIPQAARAMGLDPSRPLPVRIDAQVASMRWFIVNGMGNLQPSPRDSFVRRFFRGGLDDVEIEAFGIHTTAHRGVFTNMQSDMHLHFRTTGGEPFVGHIDDDMVLKPGGRLLLPQAWSA
jgi:acetolactate decarboxylase